MSRKAIALVMLGVGIIFLLFAIAHPEAHFPWPNGVTYTFYAA